MVLTSKKVVALAGGVGGAKLVYGLAQQLSPDQLVIVGNVADDFSLYGLHISPDLDTVMYTLAGIAHPINGWGIAGDTGQMLEMLSRYGQDAWFRLGDRDLATHLLRTQWLAEGISLTEVTAQLLRGLGSPYHLLPVTDNPLSTVVETEEYGALDFQEYFVRYRWQPTVKRITFRGADQARMTPAVAHALQTADLILLCPSNPVLSIQPMLAVQGVREALRQRRGVCVAVSPFIGGKAIKGPAAKIMPELGLEITPRGLLHYYEGLLDGLVIDEADQHELPLAGVDVLVTNTLMQIDDDKRRLAGEILDWSGKKVR